MRPVYGMAEATLLISGQPAGTPPVARRYDADILSRGRAMEGGSANSRTLVSCGFSWGDHRIRVVNPETHKVCEPGYSGEIWFAGPSVAQGYWNRPEETQRTFGATIEGEAGPFLRTGDLGFFDGIDLFINGRLKDLIIVDGRNVYPQDLEETAEASDEAIAMNASAGFSVEIDGRERVVLACEVRRDAMRSLDPDVVAAKIRRAISEEHEVALQAVVFLRPASIPRTSSGKIQRSRTRQAYLEGKGLEIIGQWQRKPVEPASSLPRSTETRLAAWLVERISEMTGVPESEVDPREPFSSYGFGSSDAVALSGELEERLGRHLAPTLLYDYPTPALLARHLAEIPLTAVDRARGVGREAIAIVGMGCRFPGASGPEAFWKLLHDGLDAVAASPARTEGLPPTGMLTQVDKFDAEFFGINAPQAEAMDPQQRLLLEVAWEAIEDAGIDPLSLAGTKTAVAIGLSTFDYARLAQEQQGDYGPYAATGTALSIAANRISYVLDLRGPSWVVDTACSSSLVALHQACLSLERGDCDSALVGGANLILVSQVSAAFARAGLLSPDGRCRTFDKDANGYVRGEGIGVVLIKRLSDAVRDGDNVYALLRGTAVNQDGRSNGLTAPNGLAQQAVIREALFAASVEPREIGVIEAHGTGTPLGDPIEWNALTAVLGEGRSPGETCWIGSVKTNIGHLEAAAGMAGIIKTTLALQHRQIAPHLHLRSINPYIDSSQRPFQVPQQVTPWQQIAGRRLAGVSSFGFGGTNAHVVLEEPPMQTPAAPETEPPATLLAFSARTRVALEAVQQGFNEFLLAHPEVSPADFAFTSNVSRSGLAERAACVFSDRKELLACLSTPKDTSEASHIGRIFFIFSGQVSGYDSAARSLSEASPLFREFLTASGESSSFGPELSVPVFPTALARLWTALGVSPDVVLFEDEGRLAAESFAFTSGGNAVHRHDAEIEAGDLVVEIGPNAASWRAILGKLAEFFRRGGTVQWEALHHGQKRTRLRLPTYPFERKRHWIPATAQNQPVQHERRKRARSPLVQPALNAETPASAVDVAGDLLYRRVWNVLEPATGQAAPLGDWLIFADRGGLGVQLAAQMEAAGNRCTLVTASSPASAGELAHKTWRGIVHLGSLDLPPADIRGRERVSTGVIELLEHLRTRSSGKEKPVLWLVTAGAMPVLDSEAPSPSQAATWGLGQAIAVEYPELETVLLDLDPGDKNPSSLLASITSAEGESMLALRGGQRYAPRIVRHELSSADPVRFRADATYLISGGAGGLGLRLAEWLRERGAGAIALLGRTEPASLPAGSRFFRCDLGSLEQTVEAIREIERSMPPLRGVFHLAAMLSDGLLADQGGERFYTNGIAKAEGAWNLHVATSDSSLHHFVLFSSLAALVTRPGQGSYAAANNVLDALAHYRHARRKPALSINWGPWGEVGMAATDYGRAASQVLASLGVKQLSPEEALNSLEWLLSSRSTHAAVARVDWSKLLKQDRSLSACRQFGGLADVSDEPEEPATDFMHELQARPEAERQDWLSGKLAELIARELRLPDAASISPDEYFADLGLDSILALDLASQLSRLLGRALPGSLLLTAPTIGALSENLLALVHTEGTPHGTRNLEELEEGVSTLQN